MRLFAAVVPPAAAIADLDAMAADARAVHPELSWIPTDRWHLTLAFYGEVADREAARVQRRVARATKGAAALDLRFAGAGRFGDRVLWVGVQGDRDDLVAVAGRLATDGRPYRPHLTLARARGRRVAADGGAGAGRAMADGGAGAGLRAVSTLLAAYDGPSWRAVEVVLFRSYLGPKPRYEPLARWPLTPPRREMITEP